MPFEIEPRSTKYRMKLLGAFLLVAPNGRRLRLSSKKGVALLGLLATARSGERWRPWIQEKLWGSRALAQGQASLRREIHGLRRIGAIAGIPLIEADHRRVRLALENVVVDMRGERQHPARSGEFLEGMDVVGEEGFGNWLRQTRRDFDGNLWLERHFGKVEDNDEASRFHSGRRPSPSAAPHLAVDRSWLS